MSEQKRNDGGPAFPFRHLYGSGDVRESDGMSLRDYFAAKAMHAEIVTTFSDATPEAADQFVEAAVAEGRSIEQHLAVNAYAIADAMLAERERVR